MIICVLFIAALLAYCRFRHKWVYDANTVGFLHASAGAGGGGERVLWVAINSMQQADVQKGVEREYVVFTNSYSEPGASSEEKDAALLRLIDNQFQIRLQRPVTFVYLRRGMTKWLGGEQYPFCTLLLQAVCGGVLLFLEAAVCHHMTPTVVETVGVPFVYPLLRIVSGCVVVSYTHYPIISSSMIERVRLGTQPSENARFLATYPLVRHGKVLYYHSVALFYRLLGQFPHVVFTNSSWTDRHMQKLFWPRATTLLYPPCNVASLLAHRKPPALRNDHIVSVGQFRPEKNHALQLLAFKQALPKLPPTCRLVMMGGARNAADWGRVNQLKEEAQRMGIADRVDFYVNASFSEVADQLSSCLIGLHTMLDEHFGIVVLEYLAAGCVPLAHRSGGVVLDIVNRPELGYLATTEGEYAEAMIRIVTMTRRGSHELAALQKVGLQHVRSFDDITFGQKLVSHLSRYLYLST